MAITDSFTFASPEDVDIVATLTWTKPYPHEVVFSGLADEDGEAYFYAIVAYTDREWWTYYFGMVFDQWVSDRHKEPDHVLKLKKLKSDNPNINFHLSLATLNIRMAKRATKKLVGEIEGLLIYSNWHKDLINIRKVDHFNSKRSFHITNIGFVEHLDTSEIAYGVFFK